MNPEKFWDITYWGVIEIRTLSTDEVITTVTVEDLFQAFKNRLLTEDTHKK